MTGRNVVTVVPYMYRDADNYKVHGEIHLLGEITDEQRAALRDALHEGEFFIPEQLWMRHLGRDMDWVFPTDSDHCFHELDPDEITSSEVLDPPLPDETVDSWVNRFIKASTDGWDAGRYGKDFA